MTSAPGGLAENNETLRWPGVEALMESYQRHAEGEGRSAVKCFSASFRNIYL